MVERPGWSSPTLTLAACWLLATGLVVGLAAATGLALPPFVARAGPFLLAGLAAGRLARGARRRDRLVAAAVLAGLSAVAWTGFSLATRDLPARTALQLLAASLPVHLLGAAWAYLGMHLGGRGGAARAPDPELDDVERRLREDLAREDRDRQRP